MNVETKRAQVDQAMAEIERKIEGTFDPNPPKLHERPRLTTASNPAPQPKAFAPQTLPAMLAQLMTAIEAGDEQLGRRLARIEAFLGLEP